MPHYRVWRDELKARRNRNLNEYLQELIDQAVGDFQASMESGEDKKLLQTRVQIFDPGHPVLKRYEILRKKRAEDKVSTKKKLINKLEKEKSYGRRLRLAKNYLKSLPFVDEINDPFELASWARIPVTLLLHQSQQIWLSTFPDVRSNKGLHERFLDLIIKTTHALNQLWMAENGDETNDEEINKNTVLYYTEKAEALIHQLNELKLVAAEENRKDIDLAIRMMRETFRYIQEPSKNGEKEPLNEKHLEVLRLLKEDKYKAILRLDQIKLNPEINQLIRTRSRSETREHELDYETESLPQEVLSGLPQLSVGSRIRTIRLARGHRVTDVSKGSGVLLNTYTSAEKESRKGLPTPKNLIKLAKFFKVDPMLIIFGLSYEETIKAYQEEKISDYQLFDGLRRRKGLIEKELAEELEKARLQMGRKDSKSKHSHVDLWAKRVIPHPDKWPIIRKVLGEGKLYTSQEAQKRAQYIIGRTWATLRDELSNKRVSISRRANDTLISQPIDLQISETTKMDDAELKRRASQEEDGIMTLLQNLEKVLGDPTKQKMVNSALFQIPERKIRDAKFLTPQKRQELQALLDTLRDVSPKPVSNESELAQDIAKAKEILRQNSIQFPHLPAESFLVDSMRRFLLTLTTEPLNEDLLYKNTQEFLNDKAKVAKATTKSSGITDLTRKVQKIAEDVSKILISRSEAREKLKVIGGDDGVFARNQLGGEPLQREVGKRSSRIATTYPLPRSDLNSSVPPLRFNPKNSTNDQARQESAYVGPLFLGQHGSKLPENYLKVNRKLINNEILTKLSRAFSARDLVNGARNREIAPQVIAEALRRLKLNGFTKDQIDELVEWLTAQKIREFYAFEKILYTGIKGTVQINLNDDLSELQEFLRTSLALLILNPDLVIEINHSGNIKQKFAKMLADIQNTEYVGKPVSTTRLRYNSVFDSNADVIFDHDFFLDGAPVPAGTADEAILAAVSKLKRRIEDAPSGIRRISEGRYGWESPASIQPFSPQTTVVITQAQAQFREFARAA
ncbi:MAG TPA: helix-turn-helix transcriptional regulator [Candidatus Omnitrophota bacterium]|nr:helix-turn-helix transcriptional regulator [Candidatus Omnitrophota bacterium]